jgi:hypothetical protein
MRLFWRLRNGKNTSDTKFVRYYLELFLRGAAMKIPEKIKPVVLVSGARLCHEYKMSATTNNFFFAKNIWPEKARNVLYNIWLLSFEPGPNRGPDLNIFYAIRSRPGSWAGSGRGLRDRPGPVQTSTLRYYNRLFYSRCIVCYSMRCISRPSSCWGNVVSISFFDDLVAQYSLPAVSVTYSYAIISSPKPYLNISSFNLISFLLFFHPRVSWYLQVLSYFLFY